MPEKQYVNLGGDAEDTVGRGCLCNALIATAGLGECNEPALITLGEQGRLVTQNLSAREVIENIMSPEFVTSKERELSLNYRQC